MSYKWNFSTIGGVKSVNIMTGDDIAHLHELDQKMWTVLSCPTTGLDFDAKTLKHLDLDGDGKIRVNEVIATTQWLKDTLSSCDILIREEDHLKLSEFNLNTEHGRALQVTAKGILDTLGKNSDTITLADANDDAGIYSKTRFNGDAIITTQTADDDSQKTLIQDIINTCGSVKDRSGLDGVDAALIEKFYADCAAFSAWQNEAATNKDGIFPFGDNTADALANVEAVDAKIRDFFMRCKLIAYNSDATTTLDVSHAQLETISTADLSKSDVEIAAYPLASPNKEGVLNLKQGLNPAWKAAIAKVVASVGFTSEELTEELWNATTAKFDAFKAWRAAEAGTAVSALGLDRINEILKNDLRPQLTQLIDQDVAVKDEIERINEVEKLLRLCRYFYQFLKNFVTFKDFYSRNEDNLAIFQAGKLFIDQRCCDLCIRVNDMDSHNATASLSDMYLIYCLCNSRVKKETMTIVAAMTQGDIANLRVGKNGVFYDRNGLDWDAKIVKIVDNPISIRQAFFTPYRKFGNFINEQINKFAAEKENKVMADAQAGFNENTATIAENAEKPKPTPFDIAKFCGIFAAIGMALGYIGGFLVSIGEGFLGLKWWQMILAIVAVLLIISGPSMIIAFLKLRRRNLGPILNANGWAINSCLFINIVFGTTLTSIVKYPKIRLKDPFEQKMSTKAKITWWIIAIVIVIAAAIGACYLFDKDLFFYLKDSLVHLFVD